MIIIDIQSVLRCIFVFDQIEYINIQIEITRMQFRFARQYKSNTDKMTRMLRALHVSCPVSNWDDKASTGAPEIALSREQYRARSVTITHSPVPFRSEARTARADKTYDYSESDSPIGEITFPGQWRRVDNISDDVSLIRNCHSYDIL